MAPTDTLETTRTGVPEPADSHADLRARIFTLVYPEAPLTDEVLDSLLEEALTTGDPDVCADLIMTVHGRGAWRAALAMAETCAGRLPESDRLAKIVRLLAPPRVRTAAPEKRIDRSPDHEWIKQHAQDYRGEWVVLGRGRLWGHARTLAEALDQAKQAGLDQIPYVIQVSSE